MNEKKEKIKNWVVKHKNKIILGGTIVISGAILWALKSINTDTKNSEIGELPEPEDDDSEGPHRDIMELDGAKIWDLYKMDEGQYMLQTDKSEYWEQNKDGPYMEYKAVITSTDVEMENEA